MIYELESILRNKVTWIFIFIILILGIKTMVELETKNSNIDNAKACNWEAAIGEETMGRELTGFNSQKHSLEEKDWFNNYIAFKQWEVDSYKYFGQRYKENKVSETEYFIFELKHSISLFNQNSNPKKGNQNASKVFKNMLQKYESILKLDELPFDCEKLTGDPYTTDNDKSAVYESIKFNIEYNFNMLKHYGKPINIAPLKFLSTQLSLDQLPTVIIGVLTILFATAIIIESKQNRSIQLVELIPKKKSFIFKHYYISIFISVIIVLSITFGIPFLILGIRHGFSGWNLPILIDSKGFTSFVPYLHVNDSSVIGIGKAYGSRKIEGYGSITSSVLVFWTTWKFMAAAFVVSFLKLVFLSLVGFGIGLLIKKGSRALLMSACFAGIYGVSQYLPVGLKWNPFSIKSGWDTALGWTHMTWLNAVLVLVISIIIITKSIVIWNSKRDFD